MAFLAAMAPVLQVAGTVFSVISALNQGNASRQAGQYNAQVNQQNAEIARSEAEANARQQDRENYMRLGAIRAAAGKSGGAANEGSALDVLADSAAQGELERQNILYRGELRARGYSNTAALDEFGGENAQSSGYLKAGSELLGGAVRTADAYNRLRRV